MTPLTRRQLLGVGIGGATAGLLAGCATPGTTSVNADPAIPAAAPGEKVTLTYWTWLKDLQKVADIYNDAHPNVQVNTVWIPSGNKGGYQKIYSAIAAGGGPDLAQIEMRSIPEFMLVNGLVDLARYGADDYASRFDETLWNQVSFLDGVYGIPQDSGPTAMFYQPEVFDKAGASIPTTWDDWADAASKLRDQKAYIDCFPLSDASFFCMYATQAGARWFSPTDDGWQISLTDEATMRVAEFFDRAIDDDLVTTSYTQFSPAWFAAAGEGRIASATTASWGDALIEGVTNGEGKWKVAPMPTWDDDGFGSSYLGGSTSAVLANSTHPKEALDFAVWLNSSKEGIDGLIENSGIGWSANPDYIGASRMEPSDFFSGQRYNEEIFEPATREQNPDWSWWPITTQAFNILADQFRRKPSGTSLKDGVAAAENEIIDAFRQKGLTIRKERS